MLTTGLGDEITISDLPEGYSQYFAVDATMGQRITAAVYGISAGRLYGVFWDPNIGALITTVAFMMALHKIISLDCRISKIIK